MKYLYGSLFLIIVVTVWLTVGSQKKSGSDTVMTNAGKIDNNSKMPSDEIHSKLSAKNPAPNKNNVSKSFMHEMKMLKKHINEVPGDTASIKKYAELLFASHKHSEAISYYKKILKIDKKRKDILLALTFSYYNLKDLNNAEFYTNRILKYYPDDLASQYNLGAIYAGKGKAKKASAIWNKIITESPNSEQAELSRKSLDRIKKNSK